jgi:hypothetical protein
MALVKAKLDVVVSSGTDKVTKLTTETVTWVTISIFIRKQDENLDAYLVPG